MISADKSSNVAHFRSALKISRTLSVECDHRKMSGNGVSMGKTPFFYEYCSDLASFTSLQRNENGRFRDADLASIIMVGITIQRWSRDFLDYCILLGCY